MTIEYLKGDQDIAGVRLPVCAIGAGVMLQRLSRRPDADWNAAPPQWRKGRVDPPADERELFGVLYLADDVITAAFECRILSSTSDEETGDAIFELVDDEPNDEGVMPAPLMVSSHKVRTPVAFVDLESPLLRDRYGINIKGPLARTPMWRKLSLEVYKFVVANPGSVVPIVGVTYETQHRGGSGRNFALYDQFKDLTLDRGASVPLDRERLRRDVGAVR
jgi:hypothetical protein